MVMYLNLQPIKGTYQRENNLKSMQYVYGMKKTHKSKQNDKRVLGDDSWEPEKMMHRVYGSEIFKNLSCKVNIKPPCRMIFLDIMV